MRSPFVKMRINRAQTLLEKARAAMGPSTREVLELARERNVMPDETSEGMRIRLDPTAFQQLALEELAAALDELNKATSQ